MSVIRSRISSRLPLPVRKFARRLVAKRDLDWHDVRAIEVSGRFDKHWYLTYYPDVAASGMDPIVHYVRFGAAEGRNPCPDFNTRFYLRENPDVMCAGINPFRHYIEQGANEGREALPLEERPIIGGPLVSVIIPVYAVEEYLEECLNSVLKQTYRNLEIIIVDDGSPDRSYEIACAYAESDSRIRIIRRENGGLGAARNTGISNASGVYLSFVDSDDTLPPGAIARMVTSLRETGSDFVVGSMRRLRHGKVLSPDGWVKEVHAKNRARIRLSDFPGILTDVFAWNKLFDASFFRREVGGFPEKIRYEDQEATSKAYLHGVFDVLADTVYHWRVRDDGTSITQQKSNPDDLRDRFIVKQRVACVLADADKPTYESWLVKAVGFDLRPYFEQIPRTDVNYFDQMREGMLLLSKQMTPQMWQRVRLVDRLPALAVLANHRDDACTLIMRRAEYGHFVPGRLDNGVAYLDHKYLEGVDLSFDDELLKFSDADLSVVTKTTSLWWHDGQLRLEGYAYLTNLEFDDDFWISARLIFDGQSPVELSVGKREYPRADIETRDAWNAHAKSGFVVEIDPTALGLDADVAWRMEVTVGCSRLSGSYSTILRDIDPRGIMGTEAVAAISGHSRWVARIEPTNGFMLHCEQSRGALVTAIDTKDGTVTITTDQTAAETLLLVCATSRARVRVSGVRTEFGQTVFSFTLPDLRRGENREHVWEMYLYGDGNPQRLVYKGDKDSLERESLEYHRVRAIMNPSGALRLLQNRWWAVADEISLDPHAIIVRGFVDAPEPPELLARLVGETQALESDHATLDMATHRFEVRIPFDPAISAVKQVGALEKRLPSPATEGGAHSGGAADSIQSQARFQPTLLHGFSLRLSAVVQGKRSERWLLVASHLQHRLPMDRNASRYGLTFTRTQRSAALWVRFRAPYRDDERGRLAQRRLHACIWGSRAAADGEPPGLQDAILFESFSGRQISDSVLAICNEISHRRLGLRLYWTVADMGMSVPEGTMPLLIHSREWMRTLHRVRYLVNNNNFPFYFRKSAGQVYLQTWHGTPLKQIGNDVPQSNLSLSYRRLMERESSYWDFLVAQNDYAADILPKAFGYTGKVLDLGYPRNDALVGSQACHRRLVARNRLGFEPQHFVVLYAPTWRDNLSGARGYSRVNFLDFKGVRKALGNNIRLVLRGHHNTSRNVAANHAGVIDATHYPDINDLLLASDLLITDYSSVMFDYATTGKPIVFLTPDLDQYRDETRGFYLDFEDIAPGPICCNNEELFDVLTHLGETVEAYHGRYRKFARRFASRDDGAAAARVVDAVWGGQH